MTDQGGGTRVVDGTPLDKSAMTSWPRRRTAILGSEDRAGPLSTLPSAANSLPWQGQKNATPDRVSAPLTGGAQSAGLIKGALQWASVQMVTVQQAWGQ